ncbi:MAG: hypothetical protein AAB390_02655 [Patescibacteria group bacterium]
MVHKSDSSVGTSEEGEVSHESIEEFKKRVLALTGMHFEDIPKGEPDDANLHIFCRWGDIYVVGVDQNPEEDRDGNKIYKEFRVVDLSQT